MNDRMTMKNIVPARVLFLAFIALNASGADLALQAPMREIRRHFILRGPDDKALHFEVTEIIRTGDDVDENEVLVSDPGHGLLMLTQRTSFADQEVSYTISDVKKKEFIRTSFKMPFSAKTRKGTLEESAQNPELKMLPALITLTTNGGEWRSIDAGAGEWQRLRELRHSVRQTLSFFLLEGIERMRGALFSTIPGSAFYALVGKYAVYQNADDVKLELEEVSVAPACDFDRSFGYPCSEAQQKRIKAAEEAGKPLTRY